ncbi:H-NS family nucleoid-associated regulatory protein [Vibrio scophthalmi]|uniref:DNA-binding protein n=1 Tax=Vibrio scophthalmi LMG 19158 TaxID=870967 RepID=F9RRC1_9VIBR|nr:H-NS family nucleoid-associated regulatory protein [Vibrio scophthalmi]EGU33307.1 DNA-binding protein [Vibrio scophthalmi LMG 19158]
MTDILKQLSSLRRAKVLFKNATVEQVDHIIKTLQEVRDEKEVERLIEAEKAEQEQRELETLKAQILDKNIDFDKLTAMMSGSKRPRKAKKIAPETPTITYVFGDNETWNGEGEVPRNLQIQLDEGFELADFIQ